MAKFISVIEEDGRNSDRHSVSRFGISCFLAATVLIFSGGWKVPLFLHDAELTDVVIISNHHRTHAFRINNSFAITFNSSYALEKGHQVSVYYSESAKLALLYKAHDVSWVEGWTSLFKESLNGTAFQKFYGAVLALLFSIPSWYFLYRLEREFKREDHA